MLELAAVFRILDLVGVFINGILGGMLARKLRYDMVGFIVLAVLSALGGGMLRDTLLQAGKPVALTNPAYLGCAIAGGVVAFVLHLKGPLWAHTFSLLDALVLGVWAATGASKALANGLDWLPAMLLGVVTAVGGGMIRDIAAGRTPVVFGGNSLYATPAFLAAGLTVVGARTGVDSALVMLGATLLTGVLVFTANLRGWSLPVAKEEGTITMSRAQLTGLIRRAERAAWRRGREARAARDHAER